MIPIEKNFRKTLESQLKDPEFKAEWDALESEYEIIQAIVAARNSMHLTQKKLSEKTGIAQADISKIENGNANPSIKTLNRIANGLGKKLHIEFR